MSAVAIATPNAATPRRRIAGTTARSGRSAKSEPTIIHVAVFRRASGSVRKMRLRTMPIAIAVVSAIAARTTRENEDAFDGPQAATSYVHHDSIVSATARHGALRAKTHGSRNGSE